MRDGRNTLDHLKRVQDEFTRQADTFDAATIARELGWARDCLLS